MNLQKNKNSTGTSRNAIVKTIIAKHASSNTKTGTGSGKNYNDSGSINSWEHSRCGTSRGSGNKNCK